MDEFIKLFFGENTLPEIAASFALAFLGAFLSLMVHTTKRKPASPNSPFEWSWKFLWSDNVKRVITAILLIFIFIRFSQELLGIKATMWIACLIGYSNDKLAQLLKTKGVLGVEKHYEDPNIH